MFCRKISQNRSFWLNLRVFITYAKTQRKQKESKKTKKRHELFGSLDYFLYLCRVKEATFSQDK